MNSSLQRCGIYQDRHSVTSCSWGPRHSYLLLLLSSFRGLHLFFLLICVSQYIHSSVYIYLQLLIHVHGCCGIALLSPTYMCAYFGMLPSFHLPVHFCLFFVGNFIVVFGLLVCIMGGPAWDFHASYLMFFRVWFSPFFLPVIDVVFALQGYIYGNLAFALTTNLACDDGLRRRALIRIKARVSSTPPFCMFLVSVSKTSSHKCSTHHIPR